MPISFKDRLILLTVGIGLAVLGMVTSYHVKKYAAVNQVPIKIEALASNYDFTQTEGEFHGQKVVSTEALATTDDILGFTDELKRIEVDLTNQRLYAFEGEKKVYDFLISSGKWGRTPTGIFRIWGKFRYTKMSGGSKALHTYYYLPNVPYVMFFSNDEVTASRGFSLHGTYWHDNFGHPMSHGCVNMKIDEAELLYNWTLPTADGRTPARATAENPGTEIHIYGEAPLE